MFFNPPKKVTPPLVRVETVLGNRLQRVSKDPQRRKLLRQEERKTFFYTLLKPAENCGCFDSPSNIFQRIFSNLHMGQCIFWKIKGNLRQKPYFKKIVNCSLRKLMAAQNHLKPSDGGKSLDLIPPSYTPFVCDQIV